MWLLPRSMLSGETPRWNPLSKADLASVLARPLPDPAGLPADASVEAVIERVSGRGLRWLSPTGKTISEPPAASMQRPYRQAAAGVPPAERTLGSLLRAVLRGSGETGINLPLEEDDDVEWFNAAVLTEKWVLIMSVPRDGGEDPGEPQPNYEHSVFREAK